MWEGATVTVKPTAELITLASLKLRLRITGSSEDALLAELLRGAIARIDGPSGIGYAMMEQTWQKSMDCFPSTIILPGAPIKSVESITYVDVDGVTQNLQAADYRVDPDSEPVRIEPAFDLDWPSTREIIGAVKVTYILGEAVAADVVPDLIDAVCLIVGHRYENREAVVVGTIATALPLGVESILAEYRRSGAAG